MKKYNCIVVLNEDRTKLLFCKRKKEPFKGRYNFVGGKVEEGEDGRSAAYRELYEETGIANDRIQLFHFMDLTYYHPDYELELYVGKLSAPGELVEEVNPLEWLPLTENFADPDRFAGDQNVAHIVNVALKYPIQEKDDVGMDGKSEPDDFLCIGVDGCRGGWIAAVLNKGKLEIEKFYKIEDMIKKYTHFNELLIDMPIGFASSADEIRPDAAARKMISSRSPAIFSAPGRDSVYAVSEEEQIKKNKESLGKGLSRQTMAIIPKMRELDVFLQTNEEYKNVIKESHPEVCFARLNGSVVMSKKSKADGLEERLCILRQYLPGFGKNIVLEKSKEFKCNKDDIIDAVCLAVTGRLSAVGKAESIPEEPLKDRTGLRMQMVIPKEGVSMSC